MWISPDLSVIGGPLFSVTLKLKRKTDDERRFADMVVAEYAKVPPRMLLALFALSHCADARTCQHAPKGNDPSRIGSYVLHEPTGLKVRENTQTTPISLASRQYEGEWRGGLGGAVMEGRGKLHLGWGAVYSGTFTNGEMTGAGRLRLANGDTLSGTFERGLLCGDGTLDYGNGDRYSGAWVQGVRCGQGTYRTPSLTYTGAWAHDNPHGTGRLIAGGGRWEGPCAGWPCLCFFFSTERKETLKTGRW